MVQVPTDPFNGYAYVDLGLPSGNLWAKCNVGANSETDYGLYFAWASTVGYAANSGHNFSYENAPYHLSTEGEGYSKYENEDKLALADDAARANLGGAWRMPTKADFQELIDYCNTNGSIEWVTIGGVNGVKFTSPNNKYVFFPKAGGFWSETSELTVEDCSYWSSTCYDVYNAYHTYFNGNPPLTDDTRYVGLPVRAVQ